MLDTIQQKGESLVIIGKGRTQYEKSLVLVKEGTYYGHGFAERKQALETFSDVQKLVRPGVETPTIHNLISSYLTSVKEDEVILFN